MNVSMLLEMVAEADGGRLVLGSRQDGFTAAHLLNAARRTASRLKGSGARFVVLLDSNSAAVPLAMLSSAIAGLSFVPVNYRLQDDQLARIVSRVTPGLAIIGDGMSDRVSGVDGLTCWSRRDLLDGGPAGPAEGATVPEWVDPESIAVLLFTSGTTAEPKAAVLRHRHLVSYIIGTVEFLAAGPDEAQLISVPPYHIAGMSSVLSSL